MTGKPQHSKAYLTKLQVNLDIIKKMLVDHDMDYLLTIVGRERIGKSSLALEIATRFDPDFTVDQVVFDIPSLYEQVYKLNKGQVVIIDEGATAFFAREAMSTDVREGVKLLTVMGERNLLVILCVPSFFIIDKYIRQHRVAGLIKVTKRGRFKFYSKRRLKQSYYNSKSNAFVWATPCFVESFPKFKGDIWSAYKEKKAEYLSARKDEWKGEINGVKKYSITEVARILGVSYQAVYNRVNRNSIEYSTDAFGKVFFTEEQLTALTDKKEKPAQATRDKE